MKKIKKVKEEILGLGDLEDITEEISLQEILASLLDGEHNLELKTHIFNPKDLASLRLLASFLKIEDLKSSGDLIKKFIKFYLRYMVSYQRKSREEIVKAIASLLDKETIKMSVNEKLTTNLSK